MQVLMYVQVPDYHVHLMTFVKGPKFLYACLIYVSLFKVYGQ
jgi:hypothetical protein